MSLKWKNSAKYVSAMCRVFHLVVVVMVVVCVNYKVYKMIARLFGINGYCVTV